MERDTCTLGYQSTLPCILISGSGVGGVRGSEVGVALT